MTAIDEKLTKAEQAADLLSYDLRELRDKLPDGIERNLVECTSSLSDLIERALQTIRQSLTTERTP